MSSTATQLGKQDSAKPQPKLRALLVEDNALDAALVLRALYKDGFDVTADVVQDEAAFTRTLRAHPPEVVLADYNLPNWKGMEALKVLRSEGLDIPMILVSGALGDVTAVECIKQGATDYVLKDSLARLPEVIRRALREKDERSLRHHAEEDLARKVDELARSNADLEQFAYVASHDLQEPLRMVTAYTQLLSERYRGKLDENADKYIGYASEGAQRMQVLIQDLLAFSRVGRNSAAIGPVDCTAVMAEVLQTLAPAIQESGARVTHDALPVVWADRTQLAQLFQNLIGNAIKFRGKEPPVVSVKAEKPELRRSSRKTSSLSSNVCTRARNIRETASAWPSAKKSSSAMAERSGWNRSPVPVPASSSPCPAMVRMRPKGRHHETIARTPRGR